MHREDAGGYYNELHERRYQDELFLKHTRPLAHAHANRIPREEHQHVQTVKRHHSTHSQLSIDGAAESHHRFCSDYHTRTTRHDLGESADHTPTIHEDLRTQYQHKSHEGV